ncbi:MAG TPA: hypothetical protein VMU39_03780, partial [Solirubrobacteraceae bacterium]|nr:hypothetical protein [Solirubrobacteraceae bacterium]
ATSTRNGRSGAASAISTGALEAGACRPVGSCTASRTIGRCLDGGRAGGIADACCGSRSGDV